MGIFTSSYLYYGYALGDKGVGLYAKLTADARFSQLYQDCVSDFSRVAVLHAPGKMFILSELDSIAGYNSAPVTMVQCKQWLACKPSEFPNSQPVVRTAQEVDDLLTVSTDKRAMMETALSWVVTDDPKPEPAWYFMEWMSDSYGENSGSVSRLQRVTA